MKNAPNTFPSLGTKQAIREFAQQPDVTLAELQARLVEEHGARFGIGTLWRFFDRRRITFKKRPRTLLSKSGAM